MNIYYSDIHKKHDFRSNSNDEKEQELYYEVPDRIDSILDALEDESWSNITAPDDFGLEPIKKIHTVEYLDYLKSAYHDWMDQSEKTGVAYIPYKPGFNKSDLPYDDIPDKDGFFMTDMNVEVNESTYLAAIASANSALSTATSLLNGEKSAFGLCRPPGHHSGASICGGFCFLNNAAIAANWLSVHGKVAILDIDYHAGNGTQSLFYERSDVLTISLHADPSWEYPRYAGYAQETGVGKGKGFHRNFPLPPQTDEALYLHHLSEAIELIHAFSPEFLIVSAGFDTFEDDPLGTFQITRNGFQSIGQEICSMRLPTGIVLEGGYQIEELGRNVVAFLEPFATQVL